MVLERCDESLFDDTLIENKYTLPQYLDIFYQIADAVDILEQYEMNHGDLWSENIMSFWKENLYEYRHYTVPEIRIIDYDSSYKKGVCENPSLGYSEEQRTRFYIGYDLCRLFDELIHMYTNYKEKKEHQRQKKAAKIKKMKQKGQCLDLDPYESDDDLREYDEDNVQYPKEFLEWMFDLPIDDPAYPKDNQRLSGKNIKQELIELANKNGIDLLKEIENRNNRAILEAKTLSDVSDESVELDEE